MDMNEYLIALRNRVRLLAALPMVVGSVTFFLLFLTGSEEYKAQATVVLPEQLVDNRSGGNQLASDFRAAVDARSVRETVSQETGVRVADIRRGITVRREDVESLIMRVSYVSTSRQATVPVVRGISEAAFEFLIEPRLSDKQGEVDRLQDDIDATQDEIADIIFEAGTAQPIASVDQLNRERASLIGTDEEGRIAAIDAELARLAPLATAYDDLIVLNDRQVTEKRDRDRELRELLQLTGTDSVESRVTADERASSVPRTSKVIRQTISAAGAALLLAVALIFYLEIVRKKGLFRLPDRDPNAEADADERGLPEGGRDFKIEETPYAEAADDDLFEGLHEDPDDDSLRDYEEISARVVDPVGVPSSGAGRPGPVSRSLLERLREHAEGLAEADSAAGSAGEPAAGDPETSDSALRDVDKESTEAAPATASAGESSRGSGWKVVRPGDGDRPA